MTPDWQVGDRVGSLISTRSGGVSLPPWDQLNVGDAVGDDPASVQVNRDRIAAQIGAQPVWLRQVHCAKVVRLDAARVGGPTLEADGAWTDRPGIACAIQVADCLPVLFAAPEGRAVAAAHAGWRGLAAGILEQTLAPLCRAAQCPAEAVDAWLGPCIGACCFEVGADVLQAFGADPAAIDPEGFAFRPRADGSPAWLADLRALAMRRLHAAGVRRIAASDDCTACDASRFFSFRRDRVCGRMVAAVWIRS
jgi:YfiH family protein